MKKRLQNTIAASMKALMAEILAGESTEQERIALAVLTDVLNRITKFMPDLDLPVS